MTLIAEISENRLGGNHLGGKAYVISRTKVLILQSKDADLRY